jgi:hypothetical protein
MKTFSWVLKSWLASGAVSAEPLEEVSSAFRVDKFE